MDRITQGFVDTFIRERELMALPADKQFEHFVSYTTLRRHYNGESIDTSDINVGGGGDLGIDSFVTLVNGTVVTDIEGVEEQAEVSGNFDVTFIFTQAKTSSSFDAGEIGDFGFGVRDFFDEKTPKLPRNDQIKSAIEIMSEIYKKLAKNFRPGNPVCHLYYVTTGTWNAPEACEVRRQAVIEDLRRTQLFRDVQYHCLGAKEIQDLYRRSKRTITSEFTFAKRILAPDITNVTEAYFGYIPFSEFLTILRDDVGEIRDIFYDNVRDWAEYKVTVNDQIRETILSEARERFLLMNNGVTIVARELRPLPKERMLIEDFSIVNGCQTSHILFDLRDEIDGKVMIPIRLIVTTSKDVKRAITRVTNSQTPVDEDQFFALTEFAEDLEDYFKTYTGDKSVYYERRGRQYDNSNVPAVRVITHRNLVRTMAAMFLEEPHTVTRSAKGLREKVGKDIFVRGHRLEPYYLGGYAFYKIDSLFRQTIAARLKPARFHILMAARLLANPQPRPQFNSKDMIEFCDAIAEKFWDAKTAEGLFAKAAKIVEEEAVSKFPGDQVFHRDNIRTQPFTEALQARCKREVA